MLPVPAYLRRHRLPVRLPGHARLGRHRHAGAGALGAVLIAVAGCGGSSAKHADIAGVCKRQQAALSAIADPTGLHGAAPAVQAVLDMNRELRPTLDGSLAARADRLGTEAQKALTSIRQSNPDQTMSPVRTAGADARRVLHAARGLLNKACR